MTYFQCSVTGKGNTVIVTCDSAFAGLVVTLTNGTKTYTKTCPSSSPYEIEFHGIEAGTWTVSAVESGVTYSSTFLVKNGVALLAHGFNWRTWVSEGGLDPDDYNDLDDVFDDEAAVRRLMLVHDSADYLIACVTEKLNDIDAFCANDTAMKWVGLCDYVCDGLEAIDGVVAKFLASDYWERYLKDHVPIMTSVSAPYGTSSCGGTNSNSYRAFDETNSAPDPGYGGDGTTANSWYQYSFNTPICVKKIKIKNYQTPTQYCIYTFKIKYSNDGSTFTDIPNTYTLESQSVPYSESYYEVNNDVYALYWRIQVLSSRDGKKGMLTRLQFYGRAMSVSVPVMTSNTAPYGEVSVDSVYSTYYSYNAFDNNSSTFWASNHYESAGVVSDYGWIQYDFRNPNICIKQMQVYTRDCVIRNLEIMKSNDGVDFETVKEYSSSITSHTANTFQMVDLDGIDCARYWRAKYRAYHSAGGAFPNANTLQFYGKDYSEKEYESGTNAVWLHDHGLDLATLTTAGTAVIGNEQITLSAANDQASKVVDLSDYSLIRAKVGDHMSGTTQIIASTTAVATLNANDAPNANGLNISAVNQELDTGVKMTSTGTCDILELWLE